MTKKTILITIIIATVLTGIQAKKRKQRKKAKLKPIVKITNYQLNDKYLNVHIEAKTEYKYFKNVRLKVSKLNDSYFHHLSDSFLKKKGKNLSFI